MLDIGSFVWAEIESRARRVLGEVHALASAYGWSEAETLSLSAVRRASYLGWSRHEWILAAPGANGGAAGAESVHPFAGSIFCIQPRRSDERLDRRDWR